MHSLEDFIETLFQKSLPRVKTLPNGWETEIDDIVARLYGLTNAELQIIEGKGDQ